jgi:hypothetical protein
LNGSGCCGSAPFRSPPAEAETLAIITARFPYWFAPTLREYAGREGELPFDQHALVAAVAPRPLISTMAAGDLWANPAGTRALLEAARAVWRFCGVEAKLAHSCREGVHEHGLTDWRAFLDFADAQLR